jgi:hypothetical protein
MKRIHALLFVILLLATPGRAGAQVTEQEFWASQQFLYRFTFTHQAGAVTGGYELTTGDEPSGAGSWNIVIAGPNGQPVRRQLFDFSGGAATVLVRYQPSGTSARVLDPQGTTALTLDLSFSRVCNENGVCDAQYGEVSTNCPADCGVGPAQQAAAIGQGSGIGKRLGAVLMGLAIAATAALLMQGVRGLVDRRHRAYDNHDNHSDA